MKTVNEVSKLSGVSIRTLHYYDSIGLLQPTTTTESNYRLYDDIALERLQRILLFRELEFPLKEIKAIMENPFFDRDKALDQQITLLQLKKEHLENLIDLAREIKTNGVTKLDFTAFDTSKIEEYTASAKATWGETKAYKEFEEKNKARSKEDSAKIYTDFMSIFAEFGGARSLPVDNADVQGLVKKLQDSITENFYTCTLEILNGLGQMYSAGGDMTENIDKMGGVGTAGFTTKAIEVYCKQNGLTI